MSVASTYIIQGDLPALSTLEGIGDGTDGAELVFHGRVRQNEQGQPIVALDYEHYAEMAEAELQAVAQETAAAYPISELVCWHRVGRVAIGDASLRVLIRSPHREEALNAMGDFIVRMKARVPIWKWGVTASGDRFPA